MNKKLLILLAMTLIALPIAASCGRTALTGQKTGQPIPHAVDVRFADCFVCHVSDFQNAKAPFDHVALKYTVKDCSSLPICHALPKGSATTKPPTTTTPPPGSTTPPPGSTTPPPSSTQVKELPTVAIAITTHNLAQMTAYKGLCQMCHGPGTTNSNPYPPTWDGKANGSTANTGVYAVTAGSTQDHTAYPVEDCTKAGCHAAPAS